MSVTVVYECPECGDRKLVAHTETGLHPQIWCSCEGCVGVEIDPETLENDE